MGRLFLAGEFDHLGREQRSLGGIRYRHRLASLGHVKDLPKSTLGVDIKNDFETDYLVIPGKEKVVAKLKKLAASADAIFVCLELSEDSTRKFGIPCRRDYGADDGIGGDKSD